MAELTITGAAKMVGLSRQHLHRGYIQTGKLSVSRNSTGQPFIDGSELVRVFGDRVKFSDTGDVTDGNATLRTATDSTTPKSDSETAILREKVTLLQQRCDELSHDKRRLEGQVDRLQALLEHKPAGEGTRLTDLEAQLAKTREDAAALSRALEAERSKGFFARLFGR